LGEDEPGQWLRRSLREIGSLTTGIYSQSGYKTTQKCRIIASPRNQQLVRLDHENHDEIHANVFQKIRRFLVRQASQCDGVVLSDYGKGVIHPELLELISNLVAEKGLICVVDPKKENFGRYRNVSLVTPNKAEASEASGIEIGDQASLREAGKRLLRTWQAEAVLITRGQEGMSLFRHSGRGGHFPTTAREVFDVTGAGDTVVAACGLALASGGTYEEAAVVANLAAGIVVGEVGTAPVPLQRLKQAIRERRYPSRRPRSG
jgi:D-beta-D-heptose 7-phosphate kinase/D-beta-D-heptose 1-phosphate adenosyltransferase